MDNSFVEKYYLVQIKKLQGETTEDSIKNIIGYAPYLPTPTQPFVIFGKNEDGSLRIVKTSDVKCSIAINSNDISFDCDNYSYYLNILDIASPQEVDEFLNESVVKNNQVLDQFMARLDIDPNKLN